MFANISEKVYIVAKKQKWMLNEEDVFNHLNARWGHETKFTHKGKSNSNCSDLEMTTQSGRVVPMGCKSPDSQGPQFVVFDNGTGKELSPRTKLKMMSAMQPIFNELNTNHAKYQNPGTAGIEVDVSAKVKAEFVAAVWTLKGEEFEWLHMEQGDPIVFDPEHPEDIFDIGMKIRCKGSGSGNPAIKVEKDIHDSLVQLGCVDTPKRDAKNHLLLETNDDVNKIKFTIGNYTYEIREEDGLPNTFRISRLSNTKNETVIVELHAKKNLVQDPKILQKFNDVRLS